MCIIYTVYCTIDRSSVNNKLFMFSVGDNLSETPYNQQQNWWNYLIMLGLLTNRMWHSHSHSQSAMTFQTRSFIILSCANNHILKHHIHVWPYTNSNNTYSQYTVWDYLGQVLILYFQPVWSLNYTTQSKSINFKAVCDGLSIYNIRRGERGSANSNFG